MDRTDAVFFGLFCFLGLAGAFCNAMIVAAALSPTIEIPRAEFTCTRSHSQLIGVIPVGKVVVPQFETVCDNYKRKD